MILADTPLMKLSIKVLWFDRFFWIIRSLMRTSGPLYPSKTYINEMCIIFLCFLSLITELQKRT